MRNSDTVVSKRLNKCQRDTLAVPEGEVFLAIWTDGATAGQQIALKRRLPRGRMEHIVDADGRLSSKLPDPTSVPIDRPGWQTNKIVRLTPEAQLKREMLAYHNHTRRAIAPPEKHEIVR